MGENAPPRRRRGLLGFSRSWYRPRPSDLITRRHSFCDLRTSDMRIDVAPASDRRVLPSHHGLSESAA